MIFYKFPRQQRPAAYARSVRRLIGVSSMGRSTSQFEKMSGQTVSLAAGILFLMACGPGRSGYEEDGPLPMMLDSIVPITVWGEDSSRVYAADELEELPRRLSGPPLRYPEHLRQCGREGTVHMGYVVNPQGTVERTSIHAVQSTHREFIYAAARAVARSSYQPGKINGVPVYTWVNQSVNFSVQSPNSVSGESFPPRSSGRSWRNPPTTRSRPTPRPC